MLVLYALRRRFRLSPGEISIVRAGRVNSIVVKHSTACAGAVSAPQDSCSWIASAFVAEPTPSKFPTIWSIFMSLANRTAGVTPGMGDADTVYHAARCQPRTLARLLHGAARHDAVPPGGLSGWTVTLAFVGYGSEATGAAIELTWNWDRTAYDRGTGYGHIALAVPDAAAACARLAAEGVKIIRPAGPMTFASPDHSDVEVIAFVEDPDGYQIELIEHRNTNSKE